MVCGVQRRRIPDWRVCGYYNVICYQNCVFKLSRPKVTSLAHLAAKLLQILSPSSPALTANHRPAVVKKKLSNDIIVLYVRSHGYRGAQKLGTYCIGVERVRLGLTCYGQPVYGKPDTRRKIYTHIKTRGRTPDVP